MTHQSPPNAGWIQTQNMFALIIGIDKYKHTEPLVGAVADAIAVEHFVKDHLRVPSERIKTLHNEKATRSKIDSAFHALCNNEDISRDHPILIYYAGHGTQMKDGNGEMRQCLVPHDAHPGNTSTDMPRIFPIPDSTIGSWLNKLSETKNNNITVIFDCCHSTSGTRDVDIDATTAGWPRDVEFEGILPSNIDSITSEVRGGTVPAGFLLRDCRSHLLLAACGAEEKARERDKRGLFTVELLKKLTLPGADKLSYEELMRKFPALETDKQSPQCEGHHKDRILFSTKITEQHPLTFRVTRVRDDTYRIEKASKIYGIAAGSIFEVYKDDEIYSEVLGNLLVDSFKSGDAYGTMKIDANKVSALAYARLTGIASTQKLRVHCEGIVLDEVQRRVLGGYIELVEKTQAELILHSKSGGNKAVFSTNREDITQHGYHQLHGVSVKLKSLSDFLIGASKWNLHLNNCQPHQWEDKVHLEFFLLEADEDNVDEEGYMVFQQGRRAVPESTIQGRTIANSANPHYVIPNRGEKSNMDKESFIPDQAVIDLVINSEDLYGIRLCNETKIDLYPYLFRFEVGQQSIACDFTPPLGGSHVTPDPPLRAGSSLTIGYGKCGAIPLGYKLPEKVDLDIGFLKLYLSTTPVDLRSLEQMSLLGHRDIDPTVMSRVKAPSWGTKTYTVVQRRAPLSRPEPYRY